LTAVFTRARSNPWGVAAGHDGTPNYIEVVKASGETVRMSKVTRYPLERGDLVRFVTGTGGGWGDPSLRASTSVLRDVQDGIVNSEQARTVYGVDPETGARIR
jgi:N-methylhydantoinase B